jgi:hypothetical protein
MTAYAITDNGTVIQFNDCNWIRHPTYQDKFTRLYQGDPDKKGRFIASVPEAWIVTYDKPCSVESRGAFSVNDAAALLLKNDNLRSVQTCMAKRLKLELEKFNRQRETWKT